MDYCRVTDGLLQGYRWTTAGLQMDYCTMHAGGVANKSPAKGASSKGPGTIVRIRPLRENSR